jgi:pimeloyl-ACP methyl ester carboxylesterase
MTTTTTPTDPASAVTWTNCGDIECGVLRVPSTHRQPDSGPISVGVYSRRAATARVGTLVLLPDYDGPTARDLATLPTVHVGAAARQFDVLAVSPRGFFDSTPLPCSLAAPYIAPELDASAASAACRSNPALEASSYGVIESVADLETLMASLRTGPVSVVGWGRGATIAATWKLMHPSSIESMVLDSPDDPGVSPVRVAAMNRAAEDAAVNAVMAWCTAHISCPLFENAGKRVGLVSERIREGRASSGATMATFRLAFLKAVTTGDYGALFRALSLAENEDYAPLVDFADTKASGATSRVAARIAGTCSDLSATDAEEIIAADAGFEETLFRIGSGDTFPRVCIGMPESADPLGFVTAADGARGSRVQVFVSATDGVTSPEMVKAFAKRAAWKFRAVKANGHLVVGRDRTTTDWVSNFLLG